MTQPPPETPPAVDGEHVAIRDVQYPLTQSPSRVRQGMRVLAGWLLGVAMPARRQRLLRGEPGRDRLGIADRLIIAALVWQHRRSGTLGALSGLHRWLWQSEQAERVHAQADARFRAWWLGRHSAIVEPLQAALDDFAVAGLSVTTLCEIGCGTGRVLADLAMRLPGPPRLLGLDLSPGQVEVNRQTYANQPRLQFEVADATVWLPAHAGPRWVYLVNGGVLEYFSEAMLEALLRGIAERHGPAIFALVEPIADDYDLDRETASRPYNSELSFGHNYLHWLQRCGWQIRHHSRQDVGGVRWLLAVAETGRIPG